MYELTGYEIREAIQEWLIRARPQHVDHLVVAELRIDDERYRDDVNWITADIVSAVVTIGGDQ